MVVLSNHMAGPSVKKGVKMVDMSIHDVSGVVEWCLGAYSEEDNPSAPSSHLSSHLVDRAFLYIYYIYAHLPDPAATWE